jgi:hypothetical protein
MAKALRKALAERRIDISHSDSLELVARQFGYANWNMLSARIDSDGKAPPLPEGWIVTGTGRPNLYRVASTQCCLVQSRSRRWIAPAWSLPTRWQA